MIEILLELRKWSITLVLSGQWRSEDIWDRIQFYVFLCAWKIWFVFCPLSLYLGWHCAHQCIVNKINGTTMWCVVLELIILARNLNHTRESSTEFSRICPRVFLYLELKFTFDKEDFLVEMFIFLILVFQAMQERDNSGKLINRRWCNNY